MPASPQPPPLFQQTDRWFQRASAALLGQLPCRLGCTSCCVGPFPITILDAHVLQEGLAQMAPDHRRSIEQRARAQIAAMEATAPKLTQKASLDDWADTDIDRLAEQFRDVPCPALESDGRCAVYSHRPLVCRSMGIPVEHHGVTQGACEVQTFIPIMRLSSAFREEEDRLGQEEAILLEAFRRTSGSTGEEVFLPYGFLYRET